MGRIVCGVTPYKDTGNNARVFTTDALTKERMYTVATLAATGCTVMFTPPAHTLCLDIDDGSLCSVVPSTKESFPLVIVESAGSVKLETATTMAEIAAYLVDDVDGQEDKETLTASLANITEEIMKLLGDLPGTDVQLEQPLKRLLASKEGIKNVSPCTLGSVVEMLSVFCKTSPKLGSLFKQLVSKKGVQCNFLSITPLEGVNPKDATVKTTFTVFVKSAPQSEAAADGSDDDNADAAEEEGDAADEDASVESEVTEDEKEDEDADGNDDDDDNDKAAGGDADADGDDADGDGDDS